MGDQPFCYFAYQRSTSVFKLAAMFASNLWNPRESLIFLSLLGQIRAAITRASLNSSSPDVLQHGAHVP